MITYCSEVGYYYWEVYMSYNVFLRKCFLAKFLDKRVNSGYIDRIDKFISGGKGGIFTLRGIVLRVKKGKGYIEKR